MRGGCACAGPYGQQLLGIEPEALEQIEAKLLSGAAVYRWVAASESSCHSGCSEGCLCRPGFVRVSFSYLLSPDELEHIISAVELVAEHGYLSLPTACLCAVLSILMV